MPKMVTELAQGNGFSRSADGGQLADQATRVFKVLLNAPNEQWLIDEAVGVSIGDTYSTQNPIPCVSLEARADGESRLVRIVTVQYRSNAGGDEGAGGQDPGTQAPDVRPANFSTSTSLYEAPAYEWREWPVGPGFLAGGWEAVANANGDPIDGVSRMESITTIRVTQFAPTPGTVHAQHCGKINSEEMNLRSYMTCDPHTVLFRGVEAAPHVESFGPAIYYGFMNSYEFAYRPNYVTQHGQCGWDATPLHTGFNVKAFDPAAPRADQDPYSQPLKFVDYKLVEPLALPDRIAVGDRGVRAMVKIVNMETGAISQQPSAQPVALNEDGTARKMDTGRPPIILRRQVQQEIDLTNTLQLRLN
jgi:hypothetical protein